MTADSKNKLSLPRESLDGREGKIRVLNLYAGIGGNRKLWPNDKIDVTAVEIEPKIAKIYQDFFPNDKVIVADAHQFLLDHFKEFDFIWSSPPCQSHSITNWYLNAQGKVRYPDMNLYEEILFLQNFATCLWCVENVKPYYYPLIPAHQIGRHLFWSNFRIVETKDNSFIGTFNRKSALIKQSNTLKRQTERNCVNPKLGLHIFNMAFKDKQKTIKDMIL